MTRIKINNDWFTEETELKTKVVKTLQGLLSANEFWQPCFCALSFDILELALAEVARLESPVTEEEVLFALGKV